MSNEPAKDPFQLWVEAILRGDPEVFGQFYDNHTVRLYKLALILARGDETLASEVHQLTMIKAARGFKRFARESEVWPWLAQIARNTYIDFVRKESLISRLLSFVKLDAREKEPPPSSEEELLQHLDKALTALEADDLTLLKGIYFEDKSQKEIAGELAKTPKAIERRLSRIRQQLRTNLLNHLRHE
jgi:RNA polymerase sigma factor (sigma-70 family)